MKIITGVTPQSYAIYIATKDIQQAIRDLKEVPSGELYARVMGAIPLEVYERIIEALKSAGAIAEKNHLLTWILPDQGPAKPATK